MAKNHSSSSGRDGRGDYVKDYQYISPNMHCIFHNEYFTGLDLKGGKFCISSASQQSSKDLKVCGDTFENRNKALAQFTFKIEDSPIESLKKECHFLPPNLQWKIFDLKTAYPGLLMGLGNPHDLTGKGIIKTGFAFDYVTGLPFINGSSLKGLLRSAFPNENTPNEMLELKQEYILALFQETNKSGESITVEDIKALEESIFDGKDIFIGAYPSLKNKDKKMLTLDYITPHPDPLKNPIPINILGVKSDVIFEFGFLLQDSILREGKVIVSADTKRDAFKAILKDIGIGAKTNIGYGQLI